MARPSTRAVHLVVAAATIAIAAFIAYQSTRPAGDPTVPVVKSWLSYVGHFGVYAILALCAMIAAWRRDVQSLVGAVLACSLFGLALEALPGQHRRPRVDAP